MAKLRDNKLLNRLTRSDLAALEDHLAPVSLRNRLRIEVTNRAVQQIVFPVSGMVSVVASGASRKLAEVGLVGREGMTGLCVVNGVGRAPFDAFVQMEGEGFAINVLQFNAAMRGSGAMTKLFYQYAHLFYVQVANTAYVNAHGKLEERLCRWLLMVHDRASGDDLPLTHEYIGVMLGVRRAGVTTGIQAIERQNLITSHRGTIKIKDRDGLKKHANGLYGKPEAEYDRLLRP